MKHLYRPQTFKKKTSIVVLFRSNYLICLGRVTNFILIFVSQAYRHKSSSVKIAKIIALTVIASSFIIGSFILASTYLQARASCDQMQALDSMLEKELMLEAMQQVSSLVCTHVFFICFIHSILISLNYRST